MPLAEKLSIRGFYWVVMEKEYKIDKQETQTGIVTNSDAADSIHLSVNLCPCPHLWSLAMDSDLRNGCEYKQWK